MDEAQSQQLENLRRQMYALTGRREPIDGIAAPEEPRRIYRAPYWLVERLNSTTVSGTSDWDTTFDDPQYARRVFGRPTALGELEYHLVDNNERSSRCRLMFDAPNKIPIDLYLAADSWGQVQIKLNGTLIDTYSANQSVFLESRIGRNVFQVSLGNEVARVECLMGILLGPVRFVDPLDTAGEGLLAEPGIDISGGSGGGAGGSPGGPIVPLPGSPTP